MNISRRYLFIGALAASSCAVKREKRAIASSVSIHKASSYNADLTGLIKTMLLEHNVPVRGKNIVLKPNLVEFSPGTPINTHPVFVASARDAFLSLGASNVTIAEGPGHRRMTLDLADAAGYFDHVRELIDLNLDSVQRVKLNDPASTLRELYLPETVLGADLLVSLAKMKTHHWAGATLSMKNLFGVVPGAVYGWPKNILHHAGIPECIADLHSLFPHQFALVDGIEAMQGNGPILGTAKHAGVIVGGPHPPSVDATCCRIMGLNPAKIEYLKLVAERTQWDVDAVKQVAETIKATKTRFQVLPEFELLRLD